MLVLSCTVTKFRMSCLEFSWRVGVWGSQFHKVIFSTLISTVGDSFRCCSTFLSARNYRSASVHSTFSQNIKLPPSISSLYYFFSFCAFRLCTLWSFISLLMAVHIHRNAARSSGFSNQHSDITAYLKELRTLLKAQTQDLFPCIIIFFFWLTD